jgi:hypothetical protein
VAVVGGIASGSREAEAEVWVSTKVGPVPLGR